MKTFTLVLSLILSPALVCAADPIEVMRRAHDASQNLAKTVPARCDKDVWDVFVWALDPGEEGVLRANRVVPDAAKPNVWQCLGSVVRANGSLPELKTKDAGLRFEVYRAALYVVGSAKCREALQTLLKQLSCSHKNRVMLIAGTLGAIGDPSALPHLRRLMASTKDEGIRASAASAIETIEHPPAPE